MDKSAFRVVKKYKNANWVGWKKDGKKSKNDNRADSFIWHLRVYS